MPKLPTDQPFEIRTSAVAGKGAFATRFIKKGEVVAEYTGEKITHAIADERYDDESMDEHHTFLFSLNTRYVLDATYGGNDARFINHACDPNCETEISDGRVWITAIKDIQPGEELAYDYAYERSGDETEADERRYKCLCGSPKCRGSIMEPVSAFKKRQREERAKKAKRAKRTKQTGTATREPRLRRRA